MDSMHEVLQAIKNTNKKSVLATVVLVEGSAYRKEGTAMLFTENRQQVGLISAGCLEEDLAIRAENMLQRDHMTETVVYDMSAEDDLSWGRGAGCNGKVHVLLEIIDTNYRNNLIRLKSHLDAGTKVALIKSMEKSYVRPTFITQDGNIFGDNEGNIPDNFSHKHDYEGQSRLIESGDEKLFIQYLSPKPHLFIFGAGPDVEPVAKIAIQTGFSVTIWDWKPARMKQDFFPGAHLLDQATLTEAIRSSTNRQDTAVVIMTHDFQKDQEILHTLRTRKTHGYLGILGPRRRTTRLMQGQPIPDFLHSPIGLDVGAEGPEEIAISIMAELVAHHHKKNTKPARPTKTAEQ